MPAELRHASASTRPPNQPVPGDWPADLASHPTDVSGGPARLTRLSFLTTCSDDLARSLYDHESLDESYNNHKGFIDESYNNHSSNW